MPAWVSAIVSAVTGLFSGAGSLSSVAKWVGLGIGTLAVVLLIVWLGWSRSSLKADLAVAQADLAAVTTALDSNRAALDELMAAAATQATALAERDRQISKINAQAKEWRRKWQEALRNDKTTREWADGPLPDAVRGMLR